MTKLPSPSLISVILFFSLLGLGFPTDRLLINPKPITPVQREVQKASTIPITPFLRGNSSGGQPILPFLSYTVEEDDTISTISARFSLDRGTIISLNQLKNPQSLRAGMKIYIPAEDGIRLKIKGKTTPGELAEERGIPEENLIPLGSEEYFLSGLTLREEEREAFWEDNFSYPLASEVVSTFGINNNDLTGLKESRDSIDFRIYKGQDVYSIGDGVVAFRGFHGTYGWYMIVNHREEFQSLYTHLDSFDVESGSTVKRGQLIAKAGDSGHSQGNVLSFSLFKMKEAVDPLEYLY